MLSAQSKLLCDCSWKYMPPFRIIHFIPSNELIEQSLFLSFAFLQSVKRML